MTYEPPTNPSLWQVLLADEEGYVTTAAAALDEYGPESHVEISIRRLSALPRQMSGGWWLSNRPEDEDDIATEWKLDMVDDIGELDHIDAQLKTAQAMAAGLNGALANEGDWNRSTALAAALHDVADKIAAYTGPISSRPLLQFGFLTFTGQDVPKVDAIAELLGTQAETRSGTPSWQHQAKIRLRDALDVSVYAYCPPPDAENPDILKARIAELEAKLAGGAQ